MTVKELEKISADKADLIKVRKIVREQAEELAKNTGYRKTRCGMGFCRIIQYQNRKRW